MRAVSDKPTSIVQRSAFRTNTDKPQAAGVLYPRKASDDDVGAQAQEFEFPFNEAVFGGPANRLG
jgi:hypothetical protein